MVVGSNPVAVTSPSDFAPASSKEFLDIQATIECGFTLKRVRDMIKTYSDVIIFSAIIFLQILTIRSSNALHNESTVVASSSTNKKIAKFSMRIMLLLCFFITPHQIIYVIRGIIQDQLNDSGKAVVELIAVISATLFYANSSANAILFLMTNVRAKRFLQNSVQQRKQ